MIKSSAIVYMRNSLIREAINKPLEEISIYDIKSQNIEDRPFLCYKQSAFVMFVDDDGSTKLLKNKFGNKGVVQSNLKHESK